MIILEWLDLNKKFLNFLFCNLILLILTISCQSAQEENRSNISTEIICSNEKRFMIRFVYASEVRKAIENHIVRKKLNKTIDNYTVIRIPNIESFHIPKIPPEEMIKCQIIDDHIYKVYPNYIKRFKKQN